MFFAKSNLHKFMQSHENHNTITHRIRKSMLKFTWKHKGLLMTNIILGIVPVVSLFLSSGLNYNSVEQKQHGGSTNTDSSPKEQSTRKQEPDLTNVTAFGKQAPSIKHQNICITIKGKYRIMYYKIPEV